MASISDLLRYKHKVELKANNEVVAEVWIRVLGDYDLQQAYKQARIASSRKRMALRTVGSDDYNDIVEPLPNNNKVEDARGIIKAARVPNIIAESYAQIDREDPPEVAEVAQEPDAASLEDQETLDKIELEQNERHQAKIRQTVADKLDALDQELITMTDVEVYDLAKFEISNLAADQEFKEELETQRAFRATYLDEKCRTKAFLDVDDFRNAHESIKRQIIAAYDVLEISGDDIKN